jgi:cation diffusion facilitator family transporter
MIPYKTIDSGKSLDSNGSDYSMKRQQDLNMRAAMLHAMGDAICSIGVMISAGMIWYNPRYNWMDPFCTVIFSCIALYTTVPILIDIFCILLQAAPPRFPMDELRSELSEIGTLDSLQVYQMNSQDLVCTVKIQGDFYKVERILTKYHIHDYTIQTSK